MIVSTQGIVLKSYDVRETSRLAIFFTRDQGKVKGVLKGIRKDPKKFGSNIDKFSVNDFVYYRYSRSDIHLISQCDLREFFFSIREDYTRSLAANYMLELVDLIMPDEEPNLKVYQLMHAYLTSLESVKDINKLVNVFQIKILLLSGFRPHLDACVRTGKKIHGRAFFSTRLGGLLNEDSAREEGSCTAITKGTISTMLHIEREPWESALRLGLTTRVRNELKFILNSFLVYHLEKKIKSAKLLGI